MTVTDRRAKQNSQYLNMLTLLNSVTILILIPELLMYIVKIFQPSVVSWSNLSEMLSDNSQLYL